MLKVSNLSFHYPKIDENILTDVSFSVSDCSFTVIEGPSGCGKTTLINLIRGNRIPQKGSILWEKDNPHLYYGGVEESNIGILSVMDNLLLATNDYQQAIDALKKVQLDDKKDVLASRLSKGEKARLMIARILVIKPEVILLDEPSANLDLVSSKIVYQLLTMLSKTSCLIVASHDSSILEFATQIISIENSKITIKKQEINHNSSLREKEKIVSPSTKIYLKLGRKRFLHYPVLAAFRTLSLVLMLVFSFIAFSFGLVNETETKNSVIENLSGIYQCTDTRINDSDTVSLTTSKYPSKTIIPSFSIDGYTAVFEEDVSPYISDSIDDTYKSKSFYDSSLFPVYWNRKSNPVGQTISEGKKLEFSNKLIVSGFIVIGSDDASALISIVISKNSYTAFYRKYGFRNSGLGNSVESFVNSYTGNNPFSSFELMFAPYIVSYSEINDGDSFGEETLFADKYDFYVSYQRLYEWLYDRKTNNDPYFSNFNYEFGCNMSYYGLGVYNLKMKGSFSSDSSITGDIVVVSDEFFNEIMNSPLVKGEKANHYFLTSDYLKANKDLIDNETISVSSFSLEKFPVTINNCKSLAKFLAVASGVLALILVILNILFGFRSKEEFRKDQGCFKEWGIPKKYVFLSDFSLCMIATIPAGIISLIVSPFASLAWGKSIASSTLLNGTLFFSLGMCFLYSFIIFILVFMLLFVSNIVREKKYVTSRK